MRRIGLTGGVGSGKSSVAKMLAERGALVIDADALAREVVAPGSEGLAEIVAAFGPQMLLPDGSLDRQALADIVFDDPEARTTLNAITHPRIATRTAEIMKAAAPGQVVVHDVPLLVENELAPAYDLVVVVIASPETRLARLAERGMPGEEARRRMAAQATDDERRAVADVVIDNDGTWTDLQAQVERLWERINAASD